jgi:outer membrane protein OmpA-like peptidoglycan-associated protein
MAEGSARQQTENPHNTPEGEGLFQLRTILVGPEQVELINLKQRLDDPDRRASEVSAILADAIAMRGSDRKLQAALTPSIEGAIERAVKNNPRAMVSALFPLIGPVIRRAISSTLGAMMQSLNETLERSFSVEGLRWRIEALRTGKPFAEIVLLHTLIFRVEQVLLIHEKTGLLLQHVVDPGASSSDVQVISGMLTAIRDFVHDSFRMERTGSLETMKVGELTVLVEPGPHAFIVGVIRGAVPPDLRDIFQTTIEDIHKEYGRLLENFVGDAAPFEIVRPALESCLHKRMTAAARTTRPVQWIVALVAAVFLLWASIATFNYWRWSKYIERLRTENGLVVLEASTGWRHYYVTGLRDPMAADPDLILKESNVNPDRVTATWHSYFSVAPEFVLARARTLLQPPDSVKLEFRGSTLQSSGRASRSWSEQARRSALLIPGVREYDDSQLNPAWRALLERVAAIERTDVRFDKDSSTIRPQDLQDVLSLAAHLRTLARDVRAEGMSVRFELAGHSDHSGRDGSNQLLAEQRARSVALVLQMHGIDSSLLVLRGVGSRQPILSDQASEDALDRRVTFYVRMESLTLSRTKNDTEESLYDGGVRGGKN